MAMTDAKIVASVRETSGWTVADLRGEIDYSRSREMRSELDALASVPSRRLVLNLAGVSFLDSTALATLVAVRKSLSERQGRLRLCGLNSRVRALIEMTHLHRVLEIFDTESAAVA